MNKVILTDVLTGLTSAKKSGLKFDLAICDPPYNIGKSFENNANSMSHEEYMEWTKKWIKELKPVLKPQGLIYIYGFAEILAHISVLFPRENQRWLVWHYTNKTVPSYKFWQRSHESILCVWTHGKPNLLIDQIREPYTKNYLQCEGKLRKDVMSRFGKSLTKYQVHKKGALPRDVIKIPALAGGAGYKERWFRCEDCGDIYPPNQQKNHLDHKIWKHPTQKPFGLTERLISSVVRPYDPNASLLIPFAGSGSECVVAKSLGTNFLGFEKHPPYAQFANRWLELSNPLKPINSGNFNYIQQDRC